MKKKLATTLLFLVTIISWQSTALAQNVTMDDVHLFQSFFQDAPVATSAYGASFVRYDDPDLIDIGLRGGVPLSSRIELGTAIFARDVDGFGDGQQTGLAEIPLFGRFNIINSRTKLSVGGFYSLPVGDDRVSSFQPDFGFYGALRHPLSNQVVLTGNISADFRERFDEKFSTLISFNPGIIYAATEKIHLLGELRIEDEADDIAISGGIDYELSGAGRLRGNILVRGFDGGSTDVGLTGSYLFNF